MTNLSHVWQYTYNSSAQRVLDLLVPGRLDCTMRLSQQTKQEQKLTRILHPAPFANPTTDKTYQYQEIKQFLSLEPTRLICPIKNSSLLIILGKNLRSTDKINVYSQAWWCTFLMPELGRLRRKNSVFQDSQGPYLKIILLLTTTTIINISNVMKLHCDKDHLPYLFTTGL